MANLSDNQSAIYTWLGRFQFHSLLAQWLVINNAPRTSVAHLKESHSRLLSKDLSFANLCRYLSLHFPFPECGAPPDEELYFFLGKMAQEDRTGKLILNLQGKISEYLKKLPLHYTNASASNVLFSPADSADSVGLSASIASVQGLLGQTGSTNLDSPMAGTGEVAASNASRATNPMFFSSIPTATPGAALRPGQQNGGPPAAAAAPAPAPAPAPASAQDAQYTVRLKEKGDTDGVSPKYEEIFEQELPPVWRVVAAYGSTVGVGLAGSKKQAKHMASKNVLDKLSGLVA